MTDVVLGLTGDYSWNYLGGHYLNVYEYIGDQEVRSGKPPVAVVFEISRDG